MMPEFESRLEQLRQRYLERLAVEMAEIEAIAEGEPSPDALGTVQQIAHKLAGISGSLGFASVSISARKLDRDWSTSGQDLAALRAAVSELRRAAEAILN